MDEPDYNTAVYDIIEYVYRYHRENQQLPSKQQVKEEVDSASPGDVEGVKEIGLVSFTHHGDVRLEDRGYRFLENARLTKVLSENRRINASLINHERKSSAVETLFTIALMVFAGSQLFLAAIRSSSSGAIWLIGIAFFLASFVLFIALVIGWSTLKEVITEEWPG